MNSALRHPQTRDQRHDRRIKQGWIRNALSAIRQSKLQRLAKKRATKQRREKRSLSHKLLEPTPLTGNARAVPSQAISLDQTEDQAHEVVSLSESESLSFPSDVILLTDGDATSSQQTSKESESSGEAIELTEEETEKETGACDICFKKGGDTIEQATCGHKACTQCWNEWLYRQFVEERSPVCFYCRQPLKQSELVEIYRPSPSEMESTHFE